LPPSIYLINKQQCFFESQSYHPIPDMLVASTQYLAVAFIRELAVEAPNIYQVALGRTYPNSYLDL